MNVVIDINTLNKEGSQALYWNSENHNADNYLRVDRWLNDVKEFMFEPNFEVITVPILREEAEAFRRFREDAKFMVELAAHGLLPKEEQEEEEEEVPTHVPRRSVLTRVVNSIRLKKRPKKSEPEPIEPMKDPDRLDKAFDLVKTQYDEAPELRKLGALLKDLERKLDDAINAVGVPPGAFVKLSVRSPKDGPLCSNRMKALIDEKVATSDGYMDVAATVRWAAWKAMMVRSGEEALDLMLRSERVYTDLLQHELFSQANDNFDINFHVSRFFHEIDPNWEFRGFVVGGQRTALTTYSPFIYNEEIVANKAKILELIEDIWIQAVAKIQSNDYCVDFAVSPKLDKCWIVEVNNFLPPLSGAGLFDPNKARDKEIIDNGPFEFRVQEKLVSRADLKRKINDDVSLVYELAPAHLMDYAANVIDNRRYKQL